MNEQQRSEIQAASRPIHIIGATACVAIIAVAAAVFVVPGMKSRKQTHEQFAALAAATERLEAAARTNRALNAEAERLAESLEDRMVTLRTPDQLNRVLAELTELCLAQEITPEIIQPREAVPDPIAPTVPIRFEVTGSLERVYALLGHFENERPDLHVRSITIEHIGPETVRMRTVLSWLTGTTVTAQN